MQRVIASLSLLLASVGCFADGSLVTLWQADGARNTVYLLGSIHLLREQDHPLPAVIDKAYEDAEVIVMEIDMDDIDPIATQTLFTQYGMISDGRSLRDWMGEIAYSRAVEAAEKIDIPLHMMTGVEPWYAALTIEVMALSRIGFDPNLGIETWMTNKAASDGKPIEGLETIEEQLGFLDGLSVPAQRQMLLATLEEAASLEDMMDQLIDAWRSGDTGFLEAELLAAFAEYEELNQAILVDRNNRWVDQITDLLDDDDDYLVVVGALHLIGDNGVPRQLESLGVPIRQLSESTPLR
ncbi:MAG: TraB/GumN family protein [Pseudomonadota bacterium]